MRSVRGQVFVDGAFAAAEVRWANGRIEEVVPSSDAGPSLILPGFVDVHVHGGAGADFMDGESEAATAICRFHASHGTTALAATTLSASHDDILRAVRAARGVHAGDAAEVAAIHFEGPYVNPEFAGAQDRASLRDPDADELKRWIDACGGLAVIMTIAPELPGAIDLISRFAPRVAFALGHSGATFDEAMRGFDAGAQHVTHLFNAMRPFHHREPGLAGAAASSAATAEVIADGRHLHPAMLQAAATLFRGRLMLVTDAMRACGMPDGQYQLYHHEVTVRDGAARLANGALAGSVLTMDAALRFMVSIGLSLEEAVTLATSMPAKLLRLASKGTIRPGADADLVVMSPDLRIEHVIVRGETIER